MTESRANPPLEPGRIVRDVTHANRKGWMHWLPGLTALREYNPSWLRDDLVAGLVITTMLVPVGIAYAEASGVPGINGLYATIVPLLAYAMFGPSRILVLSPDSALAAVILAVVAPLSAGNPERAIALAGAMAIVSGVVSIAAGLARLGFITELLSKPIRYGYMNGIALTVILSQLPKLLGFSVAANGPFDARHGELSQACARREHQHRDICHRRQYTRRHFAAQALAACAGLLVAVVAATLVVALSGLATSAGVVVLGPLPQGLPVLRLPMIKLDDVTPILMGGVAVALVSFADTSVLSRTYAARLGTRSTRTRRCWPWASPTSPRVSSRVSR